MWYSVLMKLRLFLLVSGVVFIAGCSWNPIDWFTESDEEAAVVENVLDLAMDEDFQKLAESIDEFEEGIAAREAEGEPVSMVDVLAGIDESLAGLSTASDEEADEILTDIGEAIVSVEDEAVREGLTEEVKAIIAAIRRGEDLEGDELLLSERRPDLIYDAGEELDALSRSVVSGETDEELIDETADLVMKFSRVEDEEVNEVVKEGTKKNMEYIYDQLEKGEPIDLNKMGANTVGDCLLTVDLVKEYCNASGGISMGDGLVGMCSVGLDDAFGMPIISFAGNKWQEGDWELLKNPPFGSVNEYWDVDGFEGEALGVDFSTFDVEGEMLGDEDLFRQKSLYVKKDGIRYDFHPKTYDGKGCTFDQAVALAKDVLN